MKAHCKNTVSDRNGRPPTSSGSSWPLVQRAIHPGQRILLAMLSLGLIAALNFIPAGRATAQTFTTLHNFTALSGLTNSDGVSPFAGLVLSGNTLYGTARDGGSYSNGTVFAVNTDGTGFTILHNCTA